MDKRHLIIFRVMKSKERIMKAKLLYSLLLAGIFFSNRALAQEDWGGAQYITEAAGCNFYITNPCFYFDSLVCLESTNFSQWDNYKLGFGPLSDFWDRQSIDSTAFNLDGYDYYGPFFSYSGDRLYFSAELPGGYGGCDIWYCQWEDDHWGEPVNMGPEINSANQDLSPSLTLAEDEIYFHRNDNSDVFMEEYYEGTIYYARNIDGVWTEAEELGSPINSGTVAYEPSITADGQKLYFCSYRPDDALHYFAYVSYRNGDSWQEPIPLNGNINRLFSTPPDYTPNGQVYSISIDSSATRMLITHYSFRELMICGEVWLSELTIGVDEQNALPENFVFTAYPNPFNARTQLEFALPGQSSVEICIYDITGRLADKIDCGYLESGRHSITWDAAKLASGVYFASIATGSYNAVNRLVLLK
jgi:hypothetical protein